MDRSPRDGTRQGRPPGTWFQVDKAIVDYIAEIGTTATAVYLVLAKHANGNGDCFPGQDTIATLVGISERYVRECVTDLESRGLVSKIRTGRNNAYRLHSPPKHTGTPVPVISGGLPTTPEPQFRSDRNPSSDQTGTPVPPNKNQEQEPRTRPPPHPPKRRATVGGSLEGEEELIFLAKKAGLADTGAVGKALSRGWTVDGLRTLLAEFERRRPTWGDGITNPVGLLHKWLRTLQPDAPIPWPESTVPTPYKPTRTAKERADSCAQNRRRELKAERKHSPPEMDDIIRAELSRKGFSADVRAAVGYPEPGDCEP